MAYMALQQYEEAISSFESAMKLSKRDLFTVHALIWINCMTGRSDKARIMINELKESSQNEYVDKTLTAISAAHLGDLDEAFDYLDKAHDDRDPILVTLKYEPWVPAILRNDQRFQKLLDRIGLPQ